jgi:hypothetical protein
MAGVARTGAFTLTGLCSSRLENGQLVGDCQQCG